MPRPRAFDEPHLIDAAIELFWAKGYRAVSLADLTSQTGVTNGSLYQAYGNKWGLFLVAFGVYCERRVAVVTSAFDEQRDGVGETLRAYFDAIVDDCLAHPDRRGCLMLNTISEFGTNAAVAEISTKTVDAMERAVQQALARVAPRHASNADVAASSAQTVALSQALILLSRIGRDHEDLRTIGRNAASATEMALLAS